MNPERLYRSQERARQWLVGRAYALSRRLGSRRAAALTRPSADRVLVVLAGLIGDTVMCTPALREARRIWPQAELVVLGMRRNRELLEAAPIVDRFIEAQAIPYTIRRAHLVRRLRETLRTARFDVALILLGDQFASTLAEAKIPTRVGVRGHPLEPCLTHAYDLGARLRWGPNERLNALRVLGFDVPSDSGRPMLWVSDAQRAAATRMLATLGLEAGEPFVVIHPFGSSRRQWWPLDGLSALATAIWDSTGLRSLLIGGPTERRSMTSIVGSAIDAVGHITIPELVASIERASAVVTTDSGPWHIAGALRTPAIGLFRTVRAEYADLYETSVGLLGGSSRCIARCRWDYCVQLPCFQVGSLDTERIAEAVAGVARAKDSSSRASATIPAPSTTSTKGWSATR